MRFSFFTLFVFVFVACEKNARGQEPVSDLPQDGEEGGDTGRPSQLLHASGEGDLAGIQVRQRR